MNYTRNGLILGLVLGIAIGSVVSSYFMFTKFSIIESQIEELQQQVNYQYLDLSEFEVEVLHYMIRYPDFTLFSNNTFKTIEMDWKRSMELGNNLTFIQISKYKLRELVHNLNVDQKPISGLYMNYETETIYLFQVLNFFSPLVEGDKTIYQIHIYWWSSKTEG